VIAGEEAVTHSRPLYAVEGVTKHFGNVVALENVSFAVSAGEVIGLVGDNGAGKSTLVGVLSGAYAPNSGRIFLNGHEIIGPRPATRWPLGSKRSTRTPASPPTLQSPPISFSAVKS
jgi:branched-chain amino acid transport system ATP-binding protein